MANLPVTFFSSIATIPTTLPLVSEKAKGTGYYGRIDGMHTIQLTTESNFIGTIRIQATLTTDPTDTDWVNVDGMLFGDPIIPLPDGATVRSFTGNFVWVRAVVEQFTSGNINRVLFTHN